MKGNQMQAHAVIIEKLNDWVSKHGDGNYCAPDIDPLGDYALLPDSGIQQERREISDFCQVLLSKRLHGTALEIGLGFHGSSHFLWRQIFKKVVSIELSNDRVRNFGANIRRYYGKWVLDDKRSSFLIGSSCDPSTVAKAYSFLKDKVDLLFIDGDHRYGAVLTDWLLYKNLVRKGGIIAFDDCALDVPGYYDTSRLMSQIAAGQIDGQRHKIHKIVHSKKIGIAWYEQTA